MFEIFFRIFDAHTLLCVDDEIEIVNQSTSGIRDENIIRVSLGNWTT